MYQIIPSNSLNLLVELRMCFIKTLYPNLCEEDLLKIRAANTLFIEKAIASDKYVGFAGYVDKEIVCSAAIIIQELPPLLSSEGRKIGHIINVHTQKSFQRKGYGLGLMHFIQEWSAHNSFYKITLNATPNGSMLYKKSKFVHSDKWMEWEINIDQITTISPSYPPEKSI